MTRGQTIKTAAPAATGAAPRAGHFRHSVCRWCYKDISLDDLCKAAKKLGLQSVEILPLSDMPVLKKHDLTNAMVSGVPGGIPDGLNRLENHEKIAAYFKTTIPRAAKAGCPNLICFSGKREGMSDEQGLENCSAGVKRFIALAEKSKITVCMELLNSRVDHHGYMCDHTAWGVELCRRVGSERFKLLYDVYHMQIMEGNIIETIRKSHPFIGHYHTGGVPGRHEIDETQELNYPAIMKAIAATGFKGFVAQEFVPSGPDPLASLEKCVGLCAM